VNLKLWDQAFVSQVRIQNPPSSLQICGAIESVKVAGNGCLLPHLFGHALFGAGRESDFVSFHRQEAAARRSEFTPRYRRRDACKTGRQGKHKSQFYNILGVMGQTARPVIGSGETG
jgi:hypothetical protein